MELSFSQFGTTERIFSNFKISKTNKKIEDFLDYKGIIILPVSQV